MKARHPACLVILVAISFSFTVSAARAQQRMSSEGEASASDRPWMNRKLSPDERAELVLKELTLDEKIDLVHGEGMPGWGKPRPNAYLGNGGAGFVLGIERLGIPFIQDRKSVV